MHDWQQISHQANRKHHDGQNGYRRQRPSVSQKALTRLRTAAVLLAITGLTAGIASLPPALNDFAVMRESLPNAASSAIEICSPRQCRRTDRCDASLANHFPSS